MVAQPSSRSSFEVLSTARTGRGLFTNYRIAAGERILRFDGARFDATATGDDQWEACLLQIGPIAYMDLTGRMCFFINHSCSPNGAVAMIGSDPFLVALRNIEAGEELSYDYSLTSTDTPDSWQMSCGCGHRECRGVISGFGTVPPAVQDAYVKMGAVPSYVFRAGTYRRS